MVSFWFTLIYICIYVIYLVPLSLITRKRSVTLTHAVNYSCHYSPAPLYVYTYIFFRKVDENKFCVNHLYAGHKYTITQLVKVLWNLLLIVFMASTCFRCYIKISAFPCCLHFRFITSLPFSPYPSYCVGFLLAALICIGCFVWFCSTSSYWRFIVIKPKLVHTYAGGFDLWIWLVFFINFHKYSRFFFVEVVSWLSLIWYYLISNK